MKKFKNPKILFAKDGEEGSSDVNTFFNSLNLDFVENEPEGSGKEEKKENNEENNEEIEFEDESSEYDESDDDEEDEKTDEDASSEIALLKKQNEKLLSMIENLQNKEEKENKQEEEEKLSDPFESDLFDNLSEAMGWDSDEQKAMKTFFKEALNFNSSKTIKEATETISDVVNSTMTIKEKQAAVQKAFYSDYPELAEVKPYVSQVASTIAKEAKNNGKSLDTETILKETAKRVYKALGIKKGKAKQKDSEPERGKKPAFATPTKGRKKSPKLSQDQQMIQAIIDLDK